MDEYDTKLLQLQQESRDQLAKALDFIEKPTTVISTSSKNSVQFDLAADVVMSADDDDCKVEKTQPSSPTLTKTQTPTEMILAYADLSHPSVLHQLENKLQPMKAALVVSFTEKEKNTPLTAEEVVEKGRKTLKTQRVCISKCLYL